MAVKATAFINTFSPQADGTFALQCDFQSHDANYVGPLSVVVQALDVSSSGLDIANAISDAVATQLTAGGVTVGVMDSVRVLNKILAL